MADARENRLREVLENIAKERKYDNPEYILKKLPPTGANFTSQLFHCAITSPRKKELNLFGKVAVVSEEFRAQTPSKIFDIERHFYTKISKIYAEIEDKHEVPEEHRLVVPKFYGCIDTFLEEVIILQDLAKEGFITYDRFKSVDWSYASKAVEELAKFHALSIAYQKEYPEDYAEATKVLKREMIADSSTMIAMLQQMMGKMVQAVREENREKLMKIMAGAMKFEEVMKFYQPMRLPVIIHSDFRQSNLMHKIHEDGSVQVVIVDYQTAHTGCAANDLLYFIFTSSDGQFRQEYFSKLIDHYYEHMAAALRLFGLNPEEVFPRADFDQDLKDSMPFGLIVATMMLPMITLDAAQVPSEHENLQSIEDMTKMLMKTNDLSATRINEVVDDYVKWGLL